MANPDNLPLTKENPSLGKMIGNIFHTFAELCEKSADTEASKPEEEINKPAYLTARFFQLLFESAAFIADHIVDWIANPISLVKDFNSIFQFFFDLGKMFENWFNELSGKKAITANNEETSKPVPVEDNKENKLSSTAMLMNKSLGTYTKPKEEIIEPNALVETQNNKQENVVVKENQNNASIVVELKSSPRLSR